MASTRTRFLATVIDLALVATLAMGVLYVMGGVPVEVRAGLVLVATAVPTYLVEVSTGRSVGKLALQLRHRRPEHPDEPPDLGTFLVRWGVKWFVPGMVALLLPWTWAVVLWIVDGAPVLVGDRRALHDQLAGTRVWELVVDAP